LAIYGTNSSATLPLPIQLDYPLLPEGASCMGLCICGWLPYLTWMYEGKFKATCSYPTRPSTTDLVVRLVCLAVDYYRCRPLLGAHTQSPSSYHPRPGQVCSASLCRILDCSSLAEPRCREVALGVTSGLAIAHGRKVAACA